MSHVDVSGDGPIDRRTLSGALDDRGRPLPVDAKATASPRIVVAVEAFRG